MLVKYELELLQDKHWTESFSKNSDLKQDWMQY